MCGIAGFIDLRSSVEYNLREQGLRMAQSIAHRGPDDDGVWVDEAQRVVLAHRRLAIIDLSEHGHQPMASASGRYMTVYNGEIYNFAELRRTLEAETGGMSWRGHSDTEVLLAGFETWGAEECLRRTNGMFAIALWDRQEQVLLLARDRLGEKPLYYGSHSGCLMFGSELKAFRSHSAFQMQIEPAAVPLYARFGYVPAPWSIYKNVHKLPPGHFVKIHPASQRTSLPASQPYWRAEQPAEAPEHSWGEAEWLEETHRLLRDAVGLRMVSDVPLGAFLSGGIDSSLIVALMQSQSERPVRTFSIGFGARDHDESDYARQTARQLGTDHTELHVTPEDALQVVPLLPQIYDEPFADSSQIPTYLLAKLTREQVTVALSGDGGDELFGGYNRYVQGQRLVRAYQWLPKSVMTAASKALMSMSAATVGAVAAMMPREAAVVVAGDRFDKLAHALAARDGAGLYKRLVSHWSETDRIVPGIVEPATLLDEPGQGAGVDGAIARMMYLDLKTYLPDDILVKVDRASMAVALEARVPFLDHRVVALAARMPMQHKIRDGQGKRVLRQLLARYVDRRLFSRPKQGFAVPLAEWLRGPLRGWAEELLSPATIARVGLFDAQIVREAWQSHLGVRRNLHQPLWIILMFHAWFLHNFGQHRDG